MVSFLVEEERVVLLCAVAICVLYFFFTVWCVHHQMSVIVAFPGHTHLLLDDEVCHMHI